MIDQDVTRRRTELEWMELMSDWINLLGLRIIVVNNEAIYTTQLTCIVAKETLTNYPISAQCFQNDHLYARRSPVPWSRPFSHPYSGDVLEIKSAQNRLGLGN
jgi:hypothetical protein